MVWFKVDDKFHAHPKRYRCSLAAIGLWSVAGSWCGDREEGGVVPTHMLAAFGAAKKLAEELVTAGLWDVTDIGWQFHDWTDQNPSVGQIREKRDRDAERKRKWRLARESQRDAAGTDEGLTAESVLTRPDPTRPEVPKTERERPETPRPADTTQPTCSKHPTGDGGTACGGCAKVREWGDRNELAARDEAERSRTAALLAEKRKAAKESVPMPAELRNLATRKQATA